MRISFMFILTMLALQAWAQTPNFSLVGFATQNGGTKGGQGGTTVTATSYAQLKSYAESATTYIIMVQGTISNGSAGGQIRVASNKSIIGVGSTAFLSGVGIDVSSKNNIIIQNLKITLIGTSSPKDVNGGDCIAINGTSKNVWIDHCEIFSEDPTKQTDIDKYDGLIDIRDQTGFITVSWCYIHDHHKACLVGASDDDVYADRKVTYHHNYFNNIVKRMPMYRGSTGHFFNNYIKGTSQTEASFCLANTCLRIEKNVYETFTYMIYTNSSGVKGNAERIDNVGSQSRAYPPNCVANIPYNYSAVLTTNTSDVKSVVTQYAGVGKLSTTPVLKAPTIAITAPANNTSKVAPASFTLTATAADADGTVSKVEFFNGGTLIGTATTSPYTYTWNNVAKGTYSITAVATDNDGLKTTSTAVSLIVIAVPIRFIYTYDNSGNFAWENTNSWTPKAVPTTIDTVIIRTGEVRIGNLNHTGPVFVETNGILRLTDTSAINDLRLQGGTLKAYTSAPGMLLTSNIKVEAPSTIMAGSVAGTIFTINGTISGNFDLTKTSVGNLRINSTANGFKGNWIVSDGKLQLRSASGLGVCGVQVKANARLDIEAAASIYSLKVDSLGGVDLDQPLTTDVTVLGSENMLLGSFTNSSRPAYIGSTNTLTVKNNILAASGSISICSGATVQLQTMSSSAYSWKNPSTQVGTAQFYTTGAAGDYNVSLTNANGCKVTSANAKVTVSAVPTATITTTTPTTICSGESVTLTANGGASYKWYNGTTQVSTTQTYTATTSGSYAVEVTSANGCKTTSTNLTVTVNPLPTATITTTSPTTICNGESVVLTSSAGSSYKWFNGTTQVGTSQTYTAITEGDYKVEVSNANSCKATSVKTTVVVNTPLIPTITTSGSTTLCTGESVVLTSSAGSSYKWFNGTAEVGTSQGYIATTAGDYAVEVTNANGCKATSAKTTVTLSSSPTGAITTSGSTTLCEGESVVLSFSSGASYKWYNGTTQVATTQTYTATSAGNYSVEVTSANGCKVTSAATSVTVKPLPIATIAAAQTTICAGESTTLAASAGTSYKWFKGASQVGTSQTYTATTSGNYAVEVTNESGCKSTSDKTTVTIDAAPTATITIAGSTTICSGDSRLLTASAGTSYKWYSGATLVGTSQAYTVTSEGDYTVEVSNANGCKATSDPIQVEVSVPIMWYKDEDNDGKGDASQTIQACGKPSGYVAAADDNCPSDPNKSDPGNCGCNKTELECLDCAGVAHGTAVLDNCGICVGGTTGNTACINTGIIKGAPGSLSFAPQPFENGMVVEFKNYELIKSIIILNSLGQTVEQINDLNTPEILIGESLRSGFYNLIIISDRGTYSTKIIKN